MSRFAELRAMLIRRAVGLRGFVHEREARWVLDWCGDLLTVRYSRFARHGSYTRREDGGFDVTVPLAARDYEDAFRQLHEVGHGFLDLPPREPGCDPVRFGRLGFQAVARDESENRVFLDALRLPRPLVEHYLRRDSPDLPGLCEDSGCDEETIRRRVAWMEDHPPPTLRGPAPWCAVHGYRLWERRTESVRVLQVEAKDGSATYEFPVRNELESRLARYQLAGSLYALRPHEFQLKFAADRATCGEAMLDWPDWLDGTASEANL